MSVIKLKQESELQEQLAASKAGKKVLVLAFTAAWHAPCKQMAGVLAELAKDYPLLTFIEIEAEDFPDVCENYPLESVPTYFTIKNGEVADTLEGASPPNLVAMVKKIAKTTAALALSGSVEESNASVTEALNARLAKLVRAAPVMLFMKGEPENPRCKFSRETTTLLKEENIRFGYFDILTDDDVRQGLKTFSNWKTYPQFYVNGTLVGGLDILKEMREEGELQALIPKEAKKETLEKRLKEIINQQRVMLFMKGSPDAPECGFSNKIVSVLRECNFEFGHFNILLDQDVRQGLKTYSNWKTYPQLYVEGELIGGLDVVLAMHDEGELEELATAS